MIMRRLSRRLLRRLSRRLLRHDNKRFCFPAFDHPKKAEEIMSWFFGGSGKDNDKKDESTFSSSTSNIDGFGSGGFDSAPSTTFGNDVGSSSGLGGGLGGQKLDSFQQELIAEQQKAVIQAVMFKLTDVAFDQCVPKPSSSLSSSEQSCIAATVGKYLETTELIVGRFQGEQR